MSRAPVPLMHDSRVRRPGNDVTVVGTAAASSALHSESDATRGTSLLFLAYLTLIALEYIGLANEIGVLKAVRFTTVVSYALAVAVIARFGVGVIVLDRQPKFMLALFGLTLLSVFYAYVQMSAFNTVRPFIDAIIIFVITYLLVDRKSRIDMLAMVFAVVAVVLYVRNADKLGSSTRVGAFRAPYFLGDGNDFAWGMNVLLPVTAVLLVGGRSLLTRAVGIVGCIGCILGIVGTQSRGATLALGAALLYYCFGAARRKTLGVVTVAVVVVGVLTIAPSQYFTRMESIGDYDEDNSAQARLDAWGAAIRMAVQNPLGVGAGNFNSAYGRFYRPDSSRAEWGQARWLSAHSVYFKVLGEYGFLGLSLLVAIIIVNFRDNVRSRRQLIAAGDRAPVSDYWPVLLNMSLLGYAVNGVFLGGVLYPHLFLITGLTLSAKRLAASATSAPAAVAVGDSHRELTGGTRGARPAPTVRVSAPLRQRGRTA
jgi:probable O-glycosylation ligase (exosortase A-associated)